MADQTSRKRILTGDWAPLQGPVQRHRTRQHPSIRKFPIEFSGGTTRLWAPRSAFSHGKPSSPLPERKLYPQRPLCNLPATISPGMQRGGAGSFPYSPLIEIVPSPQTALSETDFARGYFHGLRSGHRPVVINKELPGFVGKRLSISCSGKPAT